MDSNRILIVDDDHLQRGLLTTLLGHLGFEALCASSGEECLEILNKPDVADIILLDRKMKGLDGLEVLRAIKSNPQTSHLPVILITGEDSPDEISRGINEGAFYYIVKPPALLPMQAILNSARRHLSRVRTMQKFWENSNRFVPLIQECSLSLQTIAEAEAAAAFISQFFPQPLRALMGISELLVNAIEHGNLEIKSEEKQALILNGKWQEEIERRLKLPDFAKRKVLVWLRRTPTKVEIEIRDSGPGFAYESHPSAITTQSSSGRGIALARLHSFDAIQYLEAGNHVVAWKSLTTGSV